MIRNVDDVLAEEFTSKELDQLDEYLERMIDAMRRTSARGSRGLSRSRSRSAEHGEALVFDSKDGVGQLQAPRETRRPSRRLFTAAGVSDQPQPVQEHDEEGHDEHRRDPGRRELAPDEEDRDESEHDANEHERHQGRRGSRPRRSGKPRPAKGNFAPAPEGSTSPPSDEWRWGESNPRLPSRCRGFSERSQWRGLGSAPPTGSLRRPQPRCDVPPGHEARPGGKPLLNDVPVPTAGLGREERATYL